MQIPLLSGRDFLPDDAAPAVAIVNRSFSRQYFAGENPVGKWFEQPQPPELAGRVSSGVRPRIQIVGEVPDTRSRDDVRRPIRPTAFVPFQSVDSNGAPQPSARGTFVIRTSAGNPLALAAALRQEISRARADFRVGNVRSQTQIIQSHTVRERLLAALALFFAIVALLLAAVGLYGVLDYSVLQRRREIGIRMAIGAQAGDIARRVTAAIFRMVLLGAAAGIALGFAALRYIHSLLFQIDSASPAMLLLPLLTIFAAALVAAAPAALRAVRLDPVKMLRSE
jgi:predicted lysophospholipase L1 biosynthesis ABC-type transport system permease subunit